jgi:5-methylcytosine-specific restriction endonuclease McrA
MRRKRTIEAQNTMEKSEYHKYLASREWALLKEQVKQRSKGKCERCKASPHDATHHLTYERIGNEKLEDLVGVCEDCHKFLSGKSDLDPADYRAAMIHEGLARIRRSKYLLDSAFDFMISECFSETHCFDRWHDHLSQYFSRLLSRLEEEIALIGPINNGKSACRERPPQNCQ